MSDEYTITPKEDEVLYSKRHYQRKQEILKGNKNNIQGITGRPGPISGLIIYLLDMVISFIIRIVLYLFRITSFGFHYVHNLLFGNFTGIFPKSLSKGKVYSLKFFRYILTVLVPPMGIALSKGVYGWFSILVCLILTYVNYLAGIVFAFVVTSRNRYADRFEIKELQDLKKIHEDDENPEKPDTSAFLTIVGFLSILFGAIILFLRTV